MVRRSPAVLVAWTVVHLAELVGVLGLFIGALWVMGGLLVTIPAMVVEGIGPIAAVRRSWQLTAARRWPMVGVGVFVGALTVATWRAWTTAAAGASVSSVMSSESRS